MLTVQPRRLLARPKGILVIAAFFATFYWLFLTGDSAGPIRSADLPSVGSAGQAAPFAPVVPDVGKAQPAQNPIEGDTEKSSQHETVKQIDEDKEREKERQREKEKEDRDRFEDKLRKDFERENEELGADPKAGAIYGLTLSTLSNKDADRKKKYDDALKPAQTSFDFSTDRPRIYDPYPIYNDAKWKALKRAEYVQCNGPDGVPIENIMVFKGSPKSMPAPGFGSYDVLDMDQNLCFERQTRLSPYGYSQAGKYAKTSEDWNTVKWGQLQELCLEKNQARFLKKGASNPYLESRDNHTADTGDRNEKLKRGAESNQNDANAKPQLRRRLSTQRLTESLTESSKTIEKEERTALLIRTYTGKQYSENDMQIVRSLVTELSLRTGGQYHVYLFVQVKDESADIWRDEAAYERVLRSAVPPEFVDMTILWNDEATQSTYPKLTGDQATVHFAQWLSVQKFAQEYTEYDYVWNWELDSRVTGHHYEFLEKLVAFAKKQPRRGLWERNERYYIPGVHGDYDTEFREEVESHAVNGSVWGAPDLPFIDPIGPKPPVKKPENDDYEWGVGEEADLITLAPIFNPIDSGWIMGNDILGYNDSTHDSLDVPRRATIITQSRVSRRLLNIMHVENLRGNHVFSEMTAQTVALLHGLKAVYAPIPVFFDRPWSSKQLAKWFNGGNNGESGGVGSAMGWGQEARFAGSTWYYRANPPQRMYLNWMGWEDTEVGGPDWEDLYGRPCLPPMILHPIKDVLETEPGHSSESRLPY